MEHYVGHYHLEYEKGALCCKLGWYKSKFQLEHQDLIGGGGGGNL